jgi:hypothetical protein
MTTGTQSHDQLEDLTAVEDETEVSMQAIYDEVYKHGELIIIIDRIDESRVRKGLSSIKAKQAQKMKSAGYQPENATLEFIEHEFEDKDKVKLQIVLKQKPTVKVHRVIVPEE